MDAISSSTSSGAASFLQSIIQQRQQKQQDSIAQGIQSGQISASQAAGLEKSEARISALDQQFTADGGTDVGQFAEIMRAQSHTGHRIYSLKHNDAASQNQGIAGLGGALPGITASNASLSGIIGSNASLSGILGSNAKILGLAASNAQTVGGSLWSGLQNLTQDFAQNVIQDRQQRLDARIQQAVSSGSVSTTQQQALQNMESTENSMVAQGTSGGSISGQEFFQIMSAQNIMNRQLSYFQNTQSLPGFASQGTGSSQSGSSATPSTYQPVNVSV
jgi:hypothetical protein